jgi:hypothetical protein
MQDLAYDLYIKDCIKNNRRRLNKYHFLFETSLYVNIYYPKAKKYMLKIIRKEKLTKIL